MKNEDILVIKQTEDFWKDIEKEGIRVEKAFICKKRLGYFIRNVWVKYHLPLQRLLFNKKLLKIEEGTILIYEPFITVEFVKWLSENNPTKRIIFLYLNIVRTSIRPEPIKEYAEVYTWDEGDRIKYNLGMFKGTYWPQSINTKLEKIYDVVFIGTDKGRLDSLLKLEEELNNKGLKTYFHIVGDRSYYRNRHGYKYRKGMAYEELLKLTVQSRAIVDMVQEGQVGTTFRTMESIFYEVKLISNNMQLLEYDFYDDHNIFILGKDEMDSIKDFVMSPFIPIDSAIKSTYTFSNLAKSL